MRWTRAASVAWVLMGAFLLAAGCGGGGYDPGGGLPPGAKVQTPVASKSSPPPAQPSQPQQSGLSVGIQATATAVGMAPLDTAVQGPAGVSPAGKAAPPSAQKADVGSGKRGRGYGEGIVTTPVAAYFAGKEMIAFRIQVPDAIKKFEALNDRPLKDHDEFMKLMQEYQIRLPDLREGDRYKYDPQKKELMVERPAD